MAERKIKSGQTMPPVVGLTGGIGSGKSSVSAWFTTLGVPVIDTDLISHHLTMASATALPAIKEAFGDGFITLEGTLDRAMMRRRVFSDAKARQQLEAIMHPLIAEAVEQDIKKNRYAGYVVIDIPLLTESGFFKDRLDKIVVVESRLDLQIQRAMDRSRLDLKEIKLILKSQATNEQRRAIADEVLVNNDSVEELYRQVNRLHQRCLKEFGR